MLFADPFLLCCTLLCCYVLCCAVLALQGLMAYDQYKHRARYQEAVTQPLDPGSEVARRYRSRMPAI